MGVIQALFGNTEAQNHSNWNVRMRLASSHSKVNGPQIPLASQIPLPHVTLWVYDRPIPEMRPGISVLLLILY